MALTFKTLLESHDRLDAILLETNLNEGLIDKIRSIKSLPVKALVVALAVAATAASGDAEARRQRGAGQQMQQVSYEAPYSKYSEVGRKIKDPETTRLGHILKKIDLSKEDIEYLVDFRKIGPAEVEEIKRHFENSHDQIEVDYILKAVKYVITELDNLLEPEGYSKEEWRWLSAMTNYAYTNGIRTR